MKIDSLKKIVGQCAIFLLVPFVFVFSQTVFSLIVFGFSFLPLFKIKKKVQHPIKDNRLKLQLFDQKLILQKNEVVGEIMFNISDVIANGHANGKHTHTHTHTPHT